MRTTGLVVLLLTAAAGALLLARRRARHRPVTGRRVSPTSEQADAGGGGTRACSRRPTTSDRVYVGNLRSRRDAALVRRRFAEHGQVVDVEIVNDDETGRFRGFVFVTMSSPAEAEAAITALNGMVIAGRAIRVNAADPSGR